MVVWSGIDPSKTYQLRRPQEVAHNIMGILIRQSLIGHRKLEIEYRLLMLTERRIVYI